MYFDTSLIQFPIKISTTARPSEHPIELTLCHSFRNFISHMNPAVFFYGCNQGQAREYGHITHSLFSSAHMGPLRPGGHLWAYFKPQGRRHMKDMDIIFPKIPFAFLC